MARTLACPKCRGPLRVPVEAAGKRVKCPHCSAVLSVPAKLGLPRSPTATKDDPRPPPTSTPADSRRGHTSSSNRSKNAPTRPATTPTPAVAKEAYSAKLLAELDEPIPRVRRSILYRLAMLFVAGVMIVLPLTYMLMIVGVGFLVYYHLTHNHVMLTWSVGIRGRMFVALAYVAPLVIGVIAVFFMTKPLLARPARRVRTRSLTPHGEPLLFDFVQRLCRTVGAPRPSRIDVDAQLNASASFRRGLISMFGSDLVLTIGTPLVAGLSLRQFTGVLGHELGHFSQGMGMRLSFIIRSINHWFARVVYERDEWDEWLVDTTSEMDGRISWIFGLAQICVVISRGLLWCLMMAGHFVSGALLRQMEFDADRCGARLVGSETYVSLTKQMKKLDVAAGVAFMQLQQLCQRHILPDNYAEMVLAVVKSMPEDMQIDVASSKASLFDTHPTDEARIVNVKREDKSGVFRLDGRARDLFRHFDAMARGTTWDFYSSVLGPRIKPTDMRPVAEVLAGPAQSSRKEINDAGPIPFD